jgi:hypothetical protein
MSNANNQVMVRNDQLDTSTFRFMNSFFTPYQNINCSSAPCSQMEQGKIINCGVGNNVICDTAGRQCCYSLDIKQKGAY